MKQNNREVGKEYEAKAVVYLKSLGYEIIECNFRCRQGEIDIIAKDGNYLVFCEVKYRKTRKAGEPAEAVTSAKKRRISQTAMYYLHRYGLQDMPCRFDVIGILGDDIIVYKNAFDFAE